jgi:hypothetical protein
VLAGASALGARNCGEGTLLPEGFNTGRYRSISVSTTRLEAPLNVVIPLNGLVGSPKPVVPNHADLSPAYGFTSTGGHIGLIRVGTDVSCDLSLESVFQGETQQDVENPAKYAFSALDAHIDAVRALTHPQIVWQAAFSPLGTCDGVDGRQKGLSITTLDQGLQAAQVARNVLRHLRSGNGWDPNGRTWLIHYAEFMADPVTRMSYPTDTSDPVWDQLFHAYAEFAKYLRSEFGDGHFGGTTKVGGMSFEFACKTQDECSQIVHTHPVKAFLEYVATWAVPLDFLSFQVKAAYPYDAALVAHELRDALNDADAATRAPDATPALAGTQLMLTQVAIDKEVVAANGFEQVFDDPLLGAAYYGAFAMSTSLFMQDVPVELGMVGRGPSVQSHLGATTADTIVSSELFRSDGTALPSLVALFPYRQIKGHDRVTVLTGGPDQEGLAVIAALKDSDRTLMVIISNANVPSGKASITYDLYVEGFVPATVHELDYKLAMLDRQSVGTGSFQFNDVGRISTDAKQGTLRFVHDMAIPGVHYLELRKPD